MGLYIKPGPATAKDSSLELWDTPYITFKMTTLVA
jgi:hypothetical protein